MHIKIQGKATGYGCEFSSEALHKGYGVTLFLKGQFIKFHVELRMFF